MYDLSKLMDELNLSELDELCPDDRARKQVINYTLGNYGSTRGFSPQLLKYIESEGVEVGSGLKKNSPIFLVQPQKQTITQETKSMTKKKELDSALVAAVALAIGEISEQLADNGTCALGWDEDSETLTVGVEAKPKKGKNADEGEDKPPKEKKSAAPGTKIDDLDDLEEDDKVWVRDEDDNWVKAKIVKIKKKLHVLIAGEEEEDAVALKDVDEKDIRNRTKGEENGGTEEKPPKKKSGDDDEEITQAKFKKMLKDELADDEALEKFAKKMGVTWKESKTRQVNRLRIITAINEKAGWEDPE